MGLHSTVYVQSVAAAANVVGDVSSRADVLDRNFFVVFVFFLDTLANNMVALVLKRVHLLLLQLLLLVIIRFVYHVLLAGKNRREADGSHRGCCCCCCLRVLLVGVGESVELERTRKVGRVRRRGQEQHGVVDVTIVYGAASLHLLMVMSVKRMLLLLGCRLQRQLVIAGVRRQA